jgi:NodT family efflux transporter outer membrane factor (OMF) lipoprotein
MMKNHPRSSKCGAIGMVLGLLACLSACAAVGPDYTPPAAPAPAAWHTPLGNGLEAGAADLDLGAWWQVFQDPVLTDLVKKAAGANLDAAVARARVREARARRGLREADPYPTVDGSTTASRSGGGGGETRLYSVGFDAGWEIDIFGGVRRGVEAAEGDLAAAEAGLADVMVTLAAEIGRNYMEARTLQHRLQVARANRQVQAQTYALTRSRYDVGLGDALAVQQALANLEATRSQIPLLEDNLAARFNRLAVLTGKPPGTLDDLLVERRPLSVVPPAVTVDIPAEILRRRPDVRQAERQLAAQTARIGVAEADLYPRLRLAGTFGLSAANTGDLADWASRTWSLGPSLSWRIFDAGAVRRHIEIQTAVQAQSLADYEATVLGALEEVENALSAYVQEQVRCVHLAQAAEAAAEAEMLARRRYEAGLADFSDVLDAQRTLLSYQDQLAAGRGAVVTHLIALYKALGGGWTLAPAAAWS